MSGFIKSILHGIERFFFWVSPWEDYDKVQIGVHGCCKDTDHIASMVRQALDLIRNTSPFRFTRFQREVRQIWVAPILYNLAQWEHEHRRCVLNSDYVENPATTVAELASTLIHEATHGRLETLGFKYHEDRRIDIERICFTEEIRFARRLPEGEKIIRDNERQIARPPSDWTNANMHRAELEAGLEELRQMNCPRWLYNLVERKVRKRIQRSQAGR